VGAGDCQAGSLDWHGMQGDGWAVAGGRLLLGGVGVHRSMWRGGQYSSTWGTGVAVEPGVGGLVRRTLPVVSLDVLVTVFDCV
jgi:hypothetical protein